MSSTLAHLLGAHTDQEIQAAASRWPHTVGSLLQYLRDPWHGLGERDLAYRWVTAWAMAGPDPHLITVVESWLPVTWVENPRGSWRDAKELLLRLSRAHWLSDLLTRRAAMALLCAEPNCRKLVAEHLPSESSKRCGFIAKNIALLVGGRSRYRLLKRQAKAVTMPATFRQIWRGLHDSLDVGHDGRRRHHHTPDPLRQRLRAATLRVLDQPGRGKPCHKRTLRSQTSLVSRALQLEAQGFPCAEEARLIDRLWRKTPKQCDLTTVIDVSPSSLSSPEVTARLLALALSINPEALVIGGHAPRPLEVDANRLVESVIGFVNSPGLYTPMNVGALSTAMHTTEVLVLTGDRNLAMEEYPKYVDTRNPWHQDLCMTNPVAYDEEKWHEQALELSASAIQISSMSIQPSLSSSPAS